VYDCELKNDQHSSKLVSISLTSISYSFAFKIIGTKWCV